MDILEKIKILHLKVCLAMLGLLSFFMFVGGLTFENTVQSIPWWFALLYGWSGLIVSVRFGRAFYGDTK